MHPAITARLLEINRTFYQDYAGAFAATRRRLQPGVHRILAQLSVQERQIIDLGCGSGALALAWGDTGQRGLYLGLDNSAGLLKEARRTVAAKSFPDLEIRFQEADLSQPGWSDFLLEEPLWSGALAFAVLHHIPDISVRRHLMKQIHLLLQPGAFLALSVWQFQHSPRWMARRLPWETVQINSTDVEEGDFLLDWRYTLPGQEPKPGLRYVHLFTQEELNGLASQSGFSVQEEFRSDGQGGRLGLYQIWYAVK
ncbi:MAG: class I SAM-dependent methyltransferase [Anaerolineaceae bacterium]|nr:class I SAM-dependent methyltransferase [Anaerolineaceae bacterium]